MSERLKFNTQPKAGFFRSANGRLSNLDAEERIAWAIDTLPGQHILSSSFGVQAAVMLHLVTRIVPRIPVIFIDTGYLFPETYRFVDELTERLDLNLHVYRPQLSPGWFQARHGRPWENGVEGIERYNRVHKVEPMNRGLQELNAGTWFTGLRRVQSGSRRGLPVLSQKGSYFKLHPVVDWGEHDVYRYLKRHGLPYHPLWDQGYASVGDVHTTRPYTPGMQVEETRFFGLKRECGLHE